MSVSLDDLLIPPTQEQILARLLLALQGVGFVAQSGVGLGTLDVTATPAPVFPGTVVATIVTNGEPGTATFNLLVTNTATIGGGAGSLSGPFTIPSNGVFSVPGTGTTLNFSPGNAAIAPSFVAGDAFKYSTATTAFPVMSWQEGSIPRTFTEVEAKALEDVLLTNAKSTRNSLITEARGAWLTFRAASEFKILRKLSVVAVGNLVLTDATGSGPFTINNGQLIVQSTSGLRYTNIAGGTVPLSGSLTLPFQAEQPGEKYNVPNGAIVQFVTPLPGAAVNNPDPGSGTWLTTQGVDEESDPSVIARCIARWPELGAGANAAVYRKWAIEASNQVTKTTPTIDAIIGGQVDVFVAGPSGAVSGGVVAAVQAYIDQRVPLTSTALVSTAANHPITISGSIYVTSSLMALAQAQVATNIANLFAALDIGGTLFFSQLETALQSGPGIRDVELVSPVANVTQSANQIALPTLAITWVPL